MNKRMKKYFILFFLFAIAFKIHCQDSFSEQLKKILADSDNNFSTFKGSVSELRKVDTTFVSKITLDGTSKNTIETGHWNKQEQSGKETNAYYALIDSLEFKKGMDIVKKWKRKLPNVLGKSYHQKEISLYDERFGSLKGVSFSSERITVAVYRSALPKSEYCHIYLCISVK